MLLQVLGRLVMGSELIDSSIRETDMGINPHVAAFSVSLADVMR